MPSGAAVGGRSPSAAALGVLAAVRLRPADIRWWPLTIAAAALVAVARSVATAAHPAPFAPCWRSATVVLAVALCCWNLRSAWVAFGRAGYLSAVGLLQIWVFFAFSFAAAEQTYRYDRLQLGYWQASLDDARTFRAVLLLAVFELLFFLALGRDAPMSRFGPALRPAANVRAWAAGGSVGSSAGSVAGSSGGTRPAALAGPVADRRTATILVLAAVPFLVARCQVFSELGLKTIAVTMVTRTDYFRYLEGGVNPVFWVFNALFPVFVVSVLCLAVRAAIPVPSTAGAWCYCLVLTVCTVGCSLSGGRGDLAFVVLTVVFGMRLQGYRTGRQLAPIAVPFVLSAALLFLLAQARNGRPNALTSLAGQPYVGDNYSNGDITQVLGLGRFDAFFMIVDQHVTAANLGAADYLDAIRGALDSVFLPRIVLGHALDYRHVSRDVLGPWIFGEAKGSSLPSAPGELYLAFGVVGIVAGAVVFGLVTRTVLRAAAVGRGPAQFVWVLMLWTVARALSDESYLVAVFVAQDWPLIALVGLLLRRRSADGLQPAAALTGGRFGRKRFGRGLIGRELIGRGPIGTPPAARGRLVATATGAAPTLAAHSVSADPADSAHAHHGGEG